MGTDLKTALQTAIDRAKQNATTVLAATAREWADDDTAHKALEPQQKHHLFKPTTNVSRTTFEYIRDNPGRTAKQIVEELSAFGYNQSSVTSLISQMRVQKQVFMTDDRYYPAQSEYTPLKSSKTDAVKALRKLDRERQGKPVKKEPRKQITIVRKKKDEVVTVAPLEPIFHPAPPAATATPEFNADTFIDTLTLRQARAVYEALRKVFGA